jgi:hypothetical protein
LWTDEHWQRAMANMTAVVNLHRMPCGDRTQPLEALRMVMLLAYGCNVLSERSNTQDEAAFVGMITFTSLGGLPAAWARLAAMTAADRAVAGAAARAKFIATFKPEQLFVNAGVYKLLDSMRGAQPL